MVRRRTARGKWEGKGVEVVGGSLGLRNKRAVRGTVNPSGVLHFRRGRVFTGDFFAKGRFWGLCLELVRAVFSGEVLFWGLSRVISGDFGVLVRGGDLFEGGLGFFEVFVRNFDLRRFDTYLGTTIKRKGYQNCVTVVPDKLQGLEGIVRRDGLVLVWVLDLVLDFTCITTRLSKRTTYRLGSNRVSLGQVFSFGCVAGLGWVEICRVVLGITTCTYIKTRICKRRRYRFGSTDKFTMRKDGAAIGNIGKIGQIGQIPG